MAIGCIFLLALLSGFPNLANASSVEDYHLQRGQQLEAEGKLQFAFNEYAYVLDKVPNHAIALEKLSALSIRLQQTQRAAAYLEKGLQFGDISPEIAQKFKTVQHSKPEKNDS